MAKTRRYKRVEKDIVSSFLHKIASFFKMIGRGIKNFIEVGCRKITIMIVPHSEKKVLNFQTSLFALSSGAIVFVALVIAFLYFNTNVISSSSEIARLTEENRRIQASLDELRDELLQRYQLIKTPNTVDWTLQKRSFLKTLQNSHEKILQEEILFMS